MGEIRPKKCEPRELTKDQLARRRPTSLRLAITRCTRRVALAHCGTAGCRGLTESHLTVRCFCRWFALRLAIHLCGAGKNGGSVPANKWGCPIAPEPLQLVVT